MNKYTISIEKNPKAVVVVVVGYVDQVCQSVEIQTPGLTSVQTAWILSAIPAAEKEVFNLSNQFTFIKVNAIPPDLSFNAFYESYGYKVGKKERALKLWTALNEADRAKCLRSIPRYNQWLHFRPNMERLYPETYLSQRRFDNEFKV